MHETRINIDVARLHGSKRGVESEEADFDECVIFAYIPPPQKPEPLRPGASAEEVAEYTERWVAWDEAEAIKSRGKS